MTARTMRVTRVEAAVVVGALVAAISAVSLVSGSASAGTEREAAQEDAKRVLRAAEAWKSNSRVKGCPTLSTLQRDGHLEEDARTDDPWGKRFRVVCEGDGLTVRSYGLDGKSNTDDDLVVTAGT